MSKLLVVAENYPQLKSDANFRDLQAQLEGTENRITVARNRYIEAVQSYNVTVRSFPSNLTATAFGYKVKANFSVENEAEISKPPTVEFTHSASAAPGNATMPPAGASSVAAARGAAAPGATPTAGASSATAPSDVTSSASVVTSSAPEPASRH